MNIRALERNSRDNSGALSKEMLQPEGRMTPCGSKVNGYKWRTTCEVK
jgi:hypothetical protein